MKVSLEKVEYHLIEVEHHENGNLYNIEIKVPMSYGWLQEVHFVTEERWNQKVYPLNHIKNDKEYAYFGGNVILNTSARYNYYFTMKVNDKYMFFKRKNISENEILKDNEKWELSVNFDTPDWAKGKMMYQIFVDRFNRAGEEKMEPMPRRTIHKDWDEDVVVGPNEEGIWLADFYGGNLKGIEEKLDYIKSLGITIIYLGPVVMSQSNHRYDTADYEKVDPYAGTNEDLRELCEQAHKKGMKVILDSVFNHTGNDSKYFNQFGTFDELGAYQSKESKYYEFYKKIYAGGEEYFTFWADMPNMPQCDGSNKAWQDYIYGENGIIDKWFALGIDGLRLDVADSLTDEFIEGIRRAVRRNKRDGLIIGEVWDDGMKQYRSYLSSGKGLDTLMNYYFTDPLVRYFKYGEQEDVERIKRVISTIEHKYPKDTRLTLMNATSTHDISRAINIFGSDDFNKYDENFLNAGPDREWQKHYKLTKEQYERGKELYKAYVFLLTFYPGILSIFYGDEFGLEGMGNISNRKPFPKKVIDEELLKFFREIGEIRKNEKFLEQADLDILDITNKIFMFERQQDEEDAIVVVNRTNDNQKIILPDRFNNPDKIYTLNKSEEGELKPHGGLVLKKVRR